jgi:hypothetical protein
MILLQEFVNSNSQQELKLLPLKVHLLLMTLPLGKGWPFEVSLSIPLLFDSA